MFGYSEKGARIRDQEKKGTDLFSSKQSLRTDHNDRQWQKYRSTNRLTCRPFGSGIAIVLKSQNKAKQSDY